VFNILLRVEPLLRIDRERGEYTRAVSGQRLVKNVPATTETNATIEKLYFLGGSCRDVISKRPGQLRVRNEYQESSWGKGRQARKADNLTAICEPTV
jgi:hypothetical protein